MLTFPVPEMSQFSYRGPSEQCGGQLRSHIINGFKGNEFLNKLSELASGPQGLVELKMSAWFKGFGVISCCCTIEQRTYSVKIYSWLQV